MKKIWILMSVVLVLLTGCAEADVSLPTQISMNEVDQYLDLENVQLIDLRNQDDKFTSGYIEGSTNISFFEYLEVKALVRTDGDWEFASEDILDADMLRNLFQEDADAIFLYCGSGTRAGFVKTALESIGYENVYNIGGFADYPETGTHYVAGGGDVAPCGEPEPSN